MLKTWTEEFLSVSILARSNETRKERGARTLTGGLLLLSDRIEAGPEIYSAALPGSGWKELRTEHEARGVFR